jgi:hypothetical protein
LRSECRVAAAQEVQLYLDHVGVAHVPETMKRG